jgi:flagellum-specific ATP synthase
VLHSISRVMSSVASPQHLNLASKLRDSLATYRNAEDLINISAYQRGNNAKIDEALMLLEPITAYLRQRRDEQTTFAETLVWLQGIFQLG